MLQNFDYCTIAFFALPGRTELIVIAIVVIGYIIFGKALPRVARKTAKNIASLKKGVKDVVDDVTRMPPSDDSDEEDQSRPG